MIDTETLKAIERELDATMLTRVEQAVDKIVAAKNRGGKVVVVTGSGPNIHEGVTTLLAELMRVGLVDGVTTSSAVVAHEMGGTLDKVKRCAGASVGVTRDLLPLGGEFELTLLNKETLREIQQTLPLDEQLLARLEAAPGKTIIKGAGNLGYPMGLWLGQLAREILTLAHSHGASFEEVAGLGCDSRTMIGIAAQKGIQCS